jgi:hypothetical protein
MSRWVRTGATGPGCTIAIIIALLSVPLAGRRADAFALLPDPKTGDVRTDLQVAARWSPEPDPFGTGAGFHDGIQVAVAANFGARLGLSTAEDEERLRTVIRGAFAAWQTADLRFDIDFARTPIEGIQPNAPGGFEIDLFAVPGSHPAFQNETYFGITEYSEQFAPARLLTNGQRFDGDVILRVDIYINVDTVLAFGALLPPDRQAAALQRLLMHEIGHGIGLGHPHDPVNTNFDTDLDPFNAMLIDPVNPFAGLISSPNRNTQAIMSSDRSHVGRFLFFTELQHDDRGGRDVLYPSLVSCTADCHGDGAVDVAELVTAVSILLGERPLDDCANADADGDGGVSVDDLIVAVRNLLNGCGGGAGDAVMDTNSALRALETGRVACALDDI